MKHKFLWTILLWTLIFCVFQLPLLEFPMDTLSEFNNTVFIIIIDFYAIAYLFALCIAKYIINSLEDLVVNKNNKKEESDFWEEARCEWEDPYKIGCKDGIYFVLGIMQRYKAKGYTLEEIIEEVFRQYNNISQIQNIEKTHETIFAFGQIGTGKSFWQYLEMRHEFNEHPEKLLELVEEKGILVKFMKKGDEFMDFVPPKNDCKFPLGAVQKRDYAGKITNVYIVYVDYDANIKYYDFPQ